MAPKNILFAAYQKRLPIDQTSDSRSTRGSARQRISFNQSITIKIGTVFVRPGFFGRNFPRVGPNGVRKAGR